MWITDEDYACRGLPDWILAAAILELPVGVCVHVKIMMVVTFVATGLRSGNVLHDDGVHVGERGGRRVC